MMADPGRACNLVARTAVRCVTSLEEAHPTDVGSPTRDGAGKIGAFYAETPGRVSTRRDERWRLFHDGAARSGADRASPRERRDDAEHLDVLAPQIAGSLDRVAPVFDEQGQGDRGRGPDGHAYHQDDDPARHVRGV